MMPPSCPHLECPGTPRAEGGPPPAPSPHPLPRVQATVTDVPQTGGSRDTAPTSPAGGRDSDRGAWRLAGPPWPMGARRPHALSPCGRTGDGSPHGPVPSQTPPPETITSGVGFPHTGLGGPQTLSPRPPKLFINLSKSQTTSNFRVHSFQNTESSCGV